MKRTVSLLLLCFAACQTARMAVPPSLAQTEPFLVEGANPRRWNAPIRFGPWSTTQVREGLTWNFSPRLLGLNVGFERQPYRLVVGSGDTEVQAECITRNLALSRDGWSVDPSFGRIPVLACGFQSGASTGTLRLRTTATNAEEGMLESSGRQWTVRSIRRLEGSRIQSGDPLGYEIATADRVVAAVEVVNRGRVWIDPSLTPDESAAIAAAATALLLYERPDATE